MTGLCYINGEFAPADQASIGVADLALQRGYGVFDFGRTYGGKLFHFEENISRFRNSASALRLEVPASDDEIYRIAERLIEESDLAIPAVRLLLTGGYSPDLKNPNFIAIAEELVTYPDELHERGAKIITAEYQRELPEIKSINYLNAILLEQLRIDRGADDILYHSHHGVTECPRNNFFAFVGDTLVTASKFVLKGVTRMIVLRLAAGHFPIEERRISFAELEEIDEAFVTSTSKGILPVTLINDCEVGDGKVGDRTKKLMQIFETYTTEW